MCVCVYIYTSNMINHGLRALGRGCGYDDGKPKLTQTRYKGDPCTSPSISIGGCTHNTDKLGARFI